MFRRFAWLGLLFVLACAGACGDDAKPKAERKSEPKAASAPVMAPVARVDSERAWLDLVAQRPLALDVREDRLFIDLGRPAARNHFALAASSPWSDGEEVDGRQASVLNGRTGSFDIPLDGPWAPALHPPLEDEAETPGLAMAITVRSFVPKQTVTVLWDERPLANLSVDETWSRRTLSIPTDMSTPGEHRLRLHFAKLTDLEDGRSTAAAVASVEMGSIETIRGGAPQIGGYEVMAAGDGIKLESGGAMVWYFVPAPRSRLRISARGRGGLEILASTDVDHRKGRAPARLHQEALRETGSEFEIDLSGYGGVPLRLQVGTRGSGKGSEAQIDQLEVQVERSRPVDRRARRIRDLYIVAVEGGRPDDWFEAARADADAFPALRRLINESLVFERSYALGAAAVPSHAAWMSSVVPPVHLTVRGTFVSESQTLLPELLERAGYFSELFTANADVKSGRGLTQGYATTTTFDASPVRERDAKAVVRKVMEEAATRPHPRFFTTIVNDPQAPYEPPRDQQDDTEVPEGAPAPHLTHMWVGRVRLGKVEPDPAQLEYVRSLYAGELRVVDAALAQLIEQLEAAGDYDETVFVLVGIHGEEFFEHAGAGHGRTLFEESIRVPLAIRAPALLAPGRVDAPVDLLDLAPTIADLLGLQAPKEWQGRSLVPVIDDPQPPPTLVVSYLGDGSHAAILGNYKLILGPGRTVDSQRLYDLAADPGETRDLRAAGGHGVALRMLRNALAWQLAYEVRWRRTRWGTPGALEAAFALDLGL